MVNFLAFLLVLVIIDSKNNVASSCQEELSKIYLDTAVDMIAKAKSNIPICREYHFENHTIIKTVPLNKPPDCSDILLMGSTKSGVYTIWPMSRVTENKSLEVYCDMQTNGGGWTLIQRRGDFQNPQDYFYKDWKSYKEGFGDLEKEFWLGNDNIFALTNQKLYSAMFYLKDVNNDTRYAHYGTFWIDDENQAFTLHIANYSGNAGDAMEYHNMQKFSTKDQVNDNHKEDNCAERFKGAWWYDSCHNANLNGLNLKGEHESYADGINWEKWKGHKESMLSSEIKIRPNSFKPI